MGHVIAPDDLDPRKSLTPGAQRVLSREVFYPGKTIIRQGDESYRAYYIEKGRVEVLVKDGPHQLKISELGPGDIFGEMALITHEPRSATVRATEECVLTVISRDEIEGKIDSIQDCAIRALINVLAQRLRDTTRGQLDQYKNLSDFQDRVTGIVDRVDIGISEADRRTFRAEVMPLLDDLQRVLDKYQG